MGASFYGIGQLIFHQFKIDGASTIPLLVKIVLTMTQAAKITSNPIRVEKIIPLARFKTSGLAPAKKNITPPIISIKTAIIGTNVNMTNLMMLLIMTKKWQKVQAGSPSPPQGTNPAA
jgi:hypothetical protein